MVTILHAFSTIGLILYGSENLNFVTWSNSFSFMASCLFQPSKINLENHSMTAFIFFGTFYISAKLIVRGILIQNGKDELHDERFCNKHHSSLVTNDHELIPFALKRLRMWLGFKKQKKIRHHVRKFNEINKK
jgi:hypothetical protein